MKKLFLSVVLLLTYVFSFSQDSSDAITGTATKRISIIGAPGSKTTIEAGERVTLLNLQKDQVFNYYYVVSVDGVSVRIPLSDAKKIEFDKPSTRNELWKIVLIKASLEESILTKGYQYEMRKELEDETIEAIRNFEQYYGFFSDEYLLDYVQQLLYKIHPIALSDGRPGTLTVKILKNSTPNAFCMPTGTIILTTGLLSTIRSEDELIGILAHETAHFVLDHQVININKAITRQKRADFWTGFSTAVAAASEIYLAEKYGYYSNGNITYATAILSNSIAASINERIGANYSIEQELEADNAAVMTLSFLHKNPAALSATLSRIVGYSNLVGDYSALSGAWTQQSVLNRKTKMGETDPDKLNSMKYDQIISFVNTHNAIAEYGLQHLETTLGLTGRNIEAGVATEDDYIIRAMALRLLYDTPEKNQEALDLLSKAKGLNITPNNYIFKQEGLTLLRLGKTKEAVEAFKNYLNSMESGIADNDYLPDEIDWTKKMIFKLGVF